MKMAENSSADILTYTETHPHTHMYLRWKLFIKGKVSENFTRGMLLSLETKIDKYKIKFTDFGEKNWHIDTLTRSKL